MSPPVVRNVAQWIHPSPMPSTRGSAAEPTAAPDVPEHAVEERVRGRTSARDACHQAAEDRHTQPEPDSARTPPADFENLGYKRDMPLHYRLEHELGRGANGVVMAVTHIQSIDMFACKVVPKRLGSDTTEKKQRAHLSAVQREVSVMRTLQACLNVARLEDVFEDDDNVYIIQELCSGGELLHALGQRHYSERTVASYMRAALKTLAQCHSHGILHRDIKPGNFMLHTHDTEARVKAIDFGLAVPWTSDEDTDAITMQGTPWFLAPEVLSSKWSPKADTWAAGVMCAQLLTGRLPFNDKRNPINPALSAVLKSILTDKLDFQKAYWADISDEAKDFVQQLLNRDPEQRLTAKAALEHPWLAGDVSDRGKGQPLSLNVVQRIQRFGRSGALKRSLLELMALELAEEDATPDRADVCRLDEKGRPVMDSPHACAMALVLKYLNLEDASSVSREEVASGLQRMGYRLQDGELDRLCRTLSGNTEKLSRASVIASQLDWRYMQRHQKERWLALARRAFDAIDVDQNGAISAEEMIDALQHKIPADEVQQLYAEATATAPSQLHGAAVNRALSFRSFMAMLREPSNDSLDLYDDRRDGSVSTLKSATLRGRMSSVGGTLSAAGLPMHSSSMHNSVLGAYFSAKDSPSPGATGSLAAAASEGSGSRRRGACALEARMSDGGPSMRSADCSTHRGHNLATVMEEWRPMQS